MLVKAGADVTTYDSSFGRIVDKARRLAERLVRDGGNDEVRAAVRGLIKLIESRLEEGARAGRAATTDAAQAHAESDRGYSGAEFALPYYRYNVM